MRAAFWFRAPPRAQVNQRVDDPRDEKSLDEIVSDLSSDWRIRCVRAALGATLMFMILLIILAPLLLAIYSGVESRAQYIFKWVSGLDFFAALFLTFLVIDATIYSRVFMRRLTVTSTKWPYATIRKYRLRFIWPTNMILEIEQIFSSWLSAPVASLNWSISRLSPWRFCYFRVVSYSMISPCRGHWWSRMQQYCA